MQLTLLDRILQYSSIIVSILWPIFLIVILALAYADFHRLVKKLAPKKKA